MEGQVLITGGGLPQWTSVQHNTNVVHGFNNIITSLAPDNSAILGGTMNLITAPPPPPPPPTVFPTPGRIVITGNYDVQDNNDYPAPPENGYGSVSVNPGDGRNVDGAVPRVCNLILSTSSTTVRGQGSVGVGNGHNMNGDFLIGLGSDLTIEGSHKVVVGNRYGKIEFGENGVFIETPQHGRLPLAGTEPDQQLSEETSRILASAYCIKDVPRSALLHVYCLGTLMIVPMEYAKQVPLIEKTIAMGFRDYDAAAPRIDLEVPITQFSRVYEAMVTGDTSLLSRRDCERFALYE